MHIRSLSSVRWTEALVASVWYFIETETPCVLYGFGFRFTAWSGDMKFAYWMCLSVRNFRSPMTKWPSEQCERSEWIIWLIRFIKGHYQRRLSLTNFVGLAKCCVRWSQSHHIIFCFLFPIRNGRSRVGVDRRKMYSEIRQIRGHSSPELKSKNSINKLGEDTEGCRQAVNSGDRVAPFCMHFYIIVSILCVGYYDALFFFHLCKSTLCLVYIFLPSTATWWEGQRSRGLVLLFNAEQ